MNLTFSIVIPYFNNQNQLSACLSSIVEAKKSDLCLIEVVIVDDGSDVPAYYENFNKVLQIKYLRIPHTGSPSIPRREGVKIASGEWISFLDSDDQICAEKYAVTASHIRENPSISFFYHKLSINGSKRTIGFEMCKHLKYPDALLSHGNPIPNSSVVVKRELLINYYKKNNEIKIYPGEDYYMWLSLSMQKGYRPYFINKELGVYEKNTGAFNFQPIVAKNSYRKIIAKFLPFTSVEIHKKILAHHRYNMGSIFLSHKKIKSARRNFISAFKNVGVIFKMKCIGKLIYSFFQ